MHILQSAWMYEYQLYHSLYAARGGIKSLFWIYRLTPEQNFVKKQKQNQKQKQKQKQTNKQTLRIKN